MKSSEFSNPRDKAPLKRNWGNIQKRKLKIKKNPRVTITGFLIFNFLDNLNLFPFFLFIFGSGELNVFTLHAI